ncbi:hypothetical protein B0H14DRAFT_3709419 [Mycena olivaceomarginata]|nr:hypothetical protein B0H14DRAFT_3709419 [Mycena olivaceomarginata]
MAQPNTHRPNPASSHPSFALIQMSPRYEIEAHGPQSGGEAWQKTCRGQHNRLIPLAGRKLPFLRLMHEIMSDTTTEMSGNPEADIRWQSAAVMALQEATEAYMVYSLKHGRLRATYARRCRLERDIELARRIRGRP